MFKAPPIGSSELHWFPTNTKGEGGLAIEDWGSNPTLSAMPY